MPRNKRIVAVQSSITHSTTIIVATEYLSQAEASYLSSDELNEREKAFKQPKRATKELTSCVSYAP